MAPVEIEIVFKWYRGFPLSEIFIATKDAAGNNKNRVKIVLKN
jgi:hypothetical protein